MRWASPGKGDFAAASPMVRHLRAEHALNHFGQRREGINPADPTRFRSPALVSQTGRKPLGLKCLRSCAYT